MFYNYSGWKYFKIYLDFRLFARLFEWNKIILTCKVEKTNEARCQESEAAID